MKFPMFKKETKDRKYHEDPFRAVNFRIDEQGVMRCPNDKAFHLLYRRSVRGNQYGRKEELYECEDCSGCVNFRIDEQGVMRCPNDKAFHLLYRRSVRGNQYGRKEELYECEDCSGCPYAEKCKKTDKNRTIRINQELTAMHQEVIENLESIHGCFFTHPVRVLFATL